MPLSGNVRSAMSRVHQPEIDEQLHFTEPYNISHFVFEKWSEPEMCFCGTNLVLK